MITGRVRSGQKIDASKHLIIYGDVNPGAEVIAGGDIIILGALCGTAIAGQKKDNKSVIFALDFRPSQIQINDVVGVGGAKKSIKLPEIAFLNSLGELEITNYLDQNPFSKLPWPEVR
jgi:septum site-determining protein MinC